MFSFVVIREVTVVFISNWDGDQSCVTEKLQLVVLHFLPLFFTTSPGGSETYFLQTVVDDNDCSFHGYDAFMAWVGTVAAVGAVY